MKNKDLFIYPIISGIIIGIVVAIFNFAMTFFITKEKIIEYTVQNPTEFRFNRHLVYYSNLIKLKNVGDFPIKNLQIKYVFSNIDKGFKILGINHYTTPNDEFGNIKMLSVSQDSLFALNNIHKLVQDSFVQSNDSMISLYLNEMNPNRFFVKYEYGLLNKGDEIEVFITTLKKSEIKIYSKQEDLIFRSNKNIKERISNLSIYVVFFSMIGAFITVLLKSYKESSSSKRRNNSSKNNP